MTSLSPWQKFVSTDVDLVQASVGTLIKPHRLTLKNTTQPLRTRLRQIRLDRVRHELCQPGPDTVTQIALRWGFMHLGRFSAAYKRRFGESPSQTQHRARTTS